MVYDRRRFSGLFDHDVDVGSTFGCQLLLGGLASFVMATMICLIALMDNPFRGELSVSPQAFQLVFNDLMKK